MGAFGRRGVGEHGDEWRLVGHQGCYVVGIGRHERERGHRAATAREHLDGAGAERLDDSVYVGRLDRGRVVDPAVLADAAAEAARVIGHHGPVREVRRQRVEAAGVHRLGDHEQRWASVDGGQRATDVIGDLGLGGFEHVRRHDNTTAPAAKTHRTSCVRARPVPVARKRRARQPVSYRTIRGSPKCGKALLSANHVMADTRLP
jgi:hypothetical protein